MQTIASPSPIAKMDALAANLAKRRAELADLVAVIDNEQRAVLAKHRADLRAAYGKTAGAQAALQAVVQEHPECFVKPRTLVLHGVKFGFQKGAGRLMINDEAKTITLIRKQLDEAQAAILIKVVESINKKAAGNLTASELKKIGMHIEEAGDRVVLSYVDGALDELLNRLLADAKEEGAA